MNKFFKDLLIIVLANFLLVIGTNIFLLGSGLIPTGLTGFSKELSIIIFNLTHINLEYQWIYLLLNIPVVILGFFKVGRRFIYKTLISILAFFAIAFIFPVPEVQTSLNSGDLLIYVFIASILMGSGIGLLLKVGSSSGGIDIIAVFISLYKGKSFGVYSLLMNSAIILIAIALYQDVKVGALALINLYIITTVIDRIHNSQEKRILIVVTQKKDLVLEDVQKHIFRGTTIIKSQGGFSKEPNDTILLSISNGELYHAIDIIKTADPSSFINVLKADNVIGNFENPYQKTL